MRRSIRAILFLLILPLAYWAVFPQVVRCQLIGYSSDFQPLTPEVYVSRDTPPRQRVLLLRELQEARQRLGQLWKGPPRGKAKVILCRTPEVYEQYCRDGEGAGCSLGTPWGDSWIIINPYGRNPDVLAHELCHDELFSRIGWLRTHRRIPQWFNEGLALVVDYRFMEASSAVGSSGKGLDFQRRYEDFYEEWQYVTRGQQVVLELHELESLRDFFSGNERRVTLAYLTAGMEVSRWLAKVGQPGIEALVDAVRQGGDFPEVYRNLEQKAGKKR